MSEVLCCKAVTIRDSRWSSTYSISLTYIRHGLHSLKNETHPQRKLRQQRC